MNRFAQLTLTLLIASGAQAAVLLDPFPLTGQGSYFHGTSAENYSTFGANGSAGGLNLDFNLEYYSFANSGEYFSFRTNPSLGGFAFTPRINLGPDSYTNFSISFSNGGGMIGIYNPANELLIRIPLVGYISTRSFFSDSNGYQGTYAVIPTPEPSTFALAAGSLVLLVWRRGSSRRYANA